MTVTDTGPKLEEIPVLDSGVSGDKPSIISKFDSSNQPWVEKVEMPAAQGGAVTAIGGLLPDDPDQVFTIPSDSKLAQEFGGKADLSKNEQVASLYYAPRVVAGTVRVAAEVVGSGYSGNTIFPIAEYSTVGIPGDDGVAKFTPGIGLDMNINQSGTVKVGGYYGYDSYYGAEKWNIHMSTETSGPVGAGIEAGLESNPDYNHFYNRRYEYELPFDGYVGAFARIGNHDDTNLKIMVSTPLTEQEDLNRPNVEEKPEYRVDVQLRMPF